MLLNECEVIARRRPAHLFWPGSTTAHFFRVDNIEKAASQNISRGRVFDPVVSYAGNLSSGCPRQFNLMAEWPTDTVASSVFPGGIPIKLEAVGCHDEWGREPGKHHNMSGYTSAGADQASVPVRLNCPPEITLHCLRPADDEQWHPQFAGYAGVATPPARLSPI